MKEPAGTSATGLRARDTDLPAETMVLSQLLNKRWSCRAYTPEPVEHALIERIVAIAGRSPSWCNTQPWNVIITEGAETERFRQALYSHVTSTEPAPDHAFPRRYSGIYQERRRECGLGLYESVGIKRDDREASTRQAAENYKLFGAPHVAVITTEADLGAYGAIDCGIYISNFLLAAQSFGLGAIPQAALASHASFIRRYFSLPVHRLVVAGISFGWPDISAPVNGFRTSRASLDETVAFHS
jgi:nitroreductase